MKYTRRIVPLFIAIAFCASRLAKASPLDLDYSVTQNGSVYDYNFTLVLDNNDNSYAAGQGWNWITFGDEQSAQSPLSDFAITSAFPLGPFTNMTSSGGYHNGPTFLDFNYQIDDFGLGWVPSGVGDSLSWSGTSSTLLSQGQLLFSTLVTTNGAVAANFQVANEYSVPDGGTTITMLGGALVGLAALRRRFAK